MMLGILLAGALSPAMSLRVAVHVHTTFSDGRHTVREVAELAREAGIDAVVLSDHFMDEIRYGPPLLREGLAFEVSVPSLTPGRMEAYVRAAREAERATGVLVLPGLELTPFYYWEGSLFSGDLQLRSADRHLLVIFPEEVELEEISASLPNVASAAGRRFGLASIALLWPVVPGIWALARLVSPRLEVTRTRYFVVRRRRRPPLAWAVALLSGIALAHSWPFTLPRFDPYGGDAGFAPYRHAIDAASRKGGLTFWAHPEASTAFRHPRYPVTYRSDAYPEFVGRTPGATGFASLFEGYREAAAPGGYWDEALRGSGAGRELQAPWTLGEISLHEQGEAGGKRLGDVETVLRVRERSREAVLDALRRGAGYAVRHGAGGRLVLHEFLVTSETGTARMGELTAASGPRHIEIRLRRGVGGDSERHEPVAIAVIRDGAEVWSESLALTEEEVALHWEDDAPLRATSFYRLDVRGAYPERILSNPVFVAPLGDAP